MNEREIRLVDEYHHSMISITVEDNNSAVLRASNSGDDGYSEQSISIDLDPESLVTLFNKLAPIVLRIREQEAEQEQQAEIGRAEQEAENARKVFWITQRHYADPNTPTGFTVHLAACPVTQGSHGHRVPLDETHLAVCHGARMCARCRPAGAETAFFSTVLRTDGTESDALRTRLSNAMRAQEELALSRSH